ncbi:jg9973 [Pararge aegeria aegeria]|uniref:Jg9973 protein n=1 Tax=Pararge aegeria aegeria TaxID=348720 RepID=A0A8S4S797_9NEOP|nr:jg9973 [Pararge aegeria aegeria]
METILVGSVCYKPKKDKLENGGEMVRPERPNSLTAGKLPRRICYQGDGGYTVGGERDVSAEEQLMLSDLPEPPIAVSDIGPIPPPPMFSSPSPTRHHAHTIINTHSDCKYHLTIDVIYRIVHRLISVGLFSRHKQTNAIAFLRRIRRV